jgi:serine/threonine protein kinase
LEGLDKVDVFQPNNYFVLQNQKWFKCMLEEYQPTIEALPFNSSVRYFTFDELMIENKVQKPLGEGAFGKVYESDWEGKKFAIKFLNGSGFHNQGAKKSFISKVHIWGQFNMSIWFNFLAIAFKVQNTHKCTNTCETHLLINGSLNQCNPRILHLNIKPHNIFLDIDYTPKLVDFGLAKIINGKQCKVCITCHNFVYFVMILCMYTL